MRPEDRGPSSLLQALVFLQGSQACPVVGERDLLFQRGISGVVILKQSGTKVFSKLCGTGAVHWSGAGSVDRLGMESAPSSTAVTCLKP